MELRNAHDIPMAITEHVKRLPKVSLASSWNDLIYEISYPIPVSFNRAVVNHLKNAVYDLCSDLHRASKYTH
jgi:hypothetical protein